MAILDSLKQTWKKLQPELDERARARETESMRSLHHEKVDLPSQKKSKEEKSPLERKWPEKAEAARLAEQWRSTQPPLTPAETVREASRPVPRPVGTAPGMGPDTARQGVVYGRAQPAQSPASQPQFSAPTMESRQAGKFQDPSPRPHERLAAKLDNAPRKALNEVAGIRADTIKKLEVDLRDQERKRAI